MAKILNGSTHRAGKEKTIAAIKLAHSGTMLALDNWLKMSNYVRMLRLRKAVDEVYLRRSSGLLSAFGQLHTSCQEAWFTIHTVEEWLALAQIALSRARPWVSKNNKRYTNYHIAVIDQSERMLAAVREVIQARFPGELIKWNGTKFVFPTEEQFAEMTPEIVDLVDSSEGLVVNKFMIEKYSTMLKLESYQAMALWEQSPRQDDNLDSAETLTIPPRQSELPPVELSDANTPTYWANIFYMSKKTFIRHCKEGKIPHRKLSDRSYQVAIDAIPSNSQNRNDA